MVQALWKTVWRVLKKLQIKLPYDPAKKPLIKPPYDSISRYISEENEIIRDTCTPKTSWTVKSMDISRPE